MSPTDPGVPHLRRGFIAVKVGKHELRSDNNQTVASFPATNTHGLNGAATKYASSR
jgi:hypothetical protein